MMKEELDKLTNILPDDNEFTDEEGNELYEHFRFVADKGQNLLRVDKFLTARIENASRNRIQCASGWTGRNGMCEEISENGQADRSALQQCAAGSWKSCSQDP